MNSKKSIIVLLVAVLLSNTAVLSLCVHQVKADAAPKRGDITVPISKSVGGFRITVAVQRQKFYVSEPVMLTVTTTNVSNKPQDYVFTGIYRDFSFVVTNQKGVNTPKTLYGQSCLGADNNNQQVGMAIFKRLEPGQQVTHTVPLNALYDMTLSGAYSITAKQRFSNIGSAEAVSNTLKVQVVGEKPGI